MDDKKSQSDDRSPLPAPAVSRRGFLQGLGGTAAGLGLLGAAPGLVDSAEAEVIGPLTDTERAAQALAIRRRAAFFQSQQPLPALATNGDEELYGNHIASYTKALPHNDLGEVDPAAYQALRAALASGDPPDFNTIPTGGNGKLANPQAAYALSLIGADSHHVDIAAPPAFASAWQASEAGEVYWQAVTRDVSFDRFDSDPLTLQAADEMSKFSDFRGPKDGGSVTPGTLFRGSTPGDLTGPYISQFLYQPVPYGNKSFLQKALSPVAGDDYMTTYSAWLAVQRGQLPPSAVNLRSRPRYIINGRDLGEYVHRDFPYQAYLNAALIALGYGAAAMSLRSPYANSPSQGGFVTFGPAGILDLVARAAVAALRAAWFHKWLVHRRVRPEAFGGRVHNHMTGAASYPINSELLNSDVLDVVFGRQGTYLLPQAFPEGSPTHPSYPAGHATIAGACVTMLKAWFNEDFVFPIARVPSANGLALRAYTAQPLTLGGEANKLAANIALGRNTAGVHWRTDGVDGILVGEAIAISMLQDYLRTVNEGFNGFVFTRFDGVQVQVTDTRVILVHD